MKKSPFIFPLLLAVLLALSTAAGCSLRPETPGQTAEAAPTPEPAPTPTVPPEYTVTFRAGEEILARTTVTLGDTPALPAYESGPFRIVGWEDEQGEAVIPDELPLTADVVYSALLRPALRRNVRFISADPYGLFRPEELWTRSDAAGALYVLMPETPAEGLALPDMDPEAVYYEACSWFAAMGHVELTDFDGDGSVEFGPDEPMEAESFAAVLTQFFAPAAVEAVTAQLPAADTGLTRARAAQWLCALLELDTENTGEAAPYYPDVSPAHEAYSAIYCAGAYTGYTAEDFSYRTLDGFLWFDGYLYAWDQKTGYFHADVTLDTLYFNKGGQYTSGSEELDGYVAALIAQRCDETMTRREMLEKMHKYLRDECRYLVRNHYEAGADGWAMDEALIMLSTGKGNCYSFAGALWALGRGLGYNTVTYSGTISKNYDPHGWTEVILDGVPYICDPEIQKQYWAEQKYYDTFMLPYEKATGWQYEAPGREG